MRRPDIIGPLQRALEHSAAALTPHGLRATELAELGQAPATRHRAHAFNPLTK